MPGTRDAEPAASIGRHPISFTLYGLTFRTVQFLLSSRRDTYYIKKHDTSGKGTETAHMDHIVIFDTTLRDGEQSPGCSMNLKEKIEVAKCLEKMKVDVIEAGFAISSPGDFESVSTIAKTVRECSVASLARANITDIDTAWEAVKMAADPRIHLIKDDRFGSVRIGKHGADAQHQT